MVERISSRYIFFVADFCVVICVYIFFIYIFICDFLGG